MNYCWIYSTIIVLKNDDFILDDKNKINYYLDSSYELFQKYFGEEKILLIKIKMTEAHCKSSNEPYKSVELWKEIIEINNKLYGRNAVNNDYYNRIAETSSNKKESLSYYRLYLKEIRKEIYATKSIDFAKNYFWFAGNFYWMRKLFFRGFFFAILGNSFNLSNRLRPKKYYFLFFIPVVIFVIIFSPRIYFTLPKLRAKWEK